MTDTSNTGADLKAVDAWLRQAITERPGGTAASEWCDAEISRLEAGGVEDDVFSQRLSIASRYAPRGPLDPSR